MSTASSRYTAAVLPVDGDGALTPEAAAAHAVAGSSAPADSRPTRC